MKPIDKVIDYRGRQDHQILDQIREDFLTRKDQVSRVIIKVDTKKMAEKIVTYSSIVELHPSYLKKGNHYEVKIEPSYCTVARLKLKE